MRGSPNHDPCHRGDDSTNFSYAPRTWARGRVKGERPIDSKPSVSLPPTLLSHVLLFPSLLLLSPPCIVISRPPVDAHPRHAAVTHTSCKCSQGQPQLFHHSTKIRRLALPQACKRWLPGAELAKSPGWLNPLTGRVARILICSESSTQPCDMCK